MGKKYHRHSMGFVCVFYVWIFVIGLSIEGYLQECVYNRMDSGSKGINATNLTLSCMSDRGIVVDAVYYIWEMNSSLMNENFSCMDYVNNILISNSSYNSTLMSHNNVTRRYLSKTCDQLHLCDVPMEVITGGNITMETNCPVNSSCVVQAILVTYQCSTGSTATRSNSSAYTDTTDITTPIYTNSTGSMGVSPIYPTILSQIIENVTGLPYNASINTPYTALFDETNTMDSDNQYSVTTVKQMVSEGDESTSQININNRTKDSQYTVTTVKQMVSEGDESTSQININNRTKDSQYTVTTEKQTVTEVGLPVNASGDSTSWTFINYTTTENHHTETMMEETITGGDEGASGEDPSQIYNDYTTIKTSNEDTTKGIYTVLLNTTILEGNTSINTASTKTEKTTADTRANTVGITTEQPIFLTLELSELITLVSAIAVIIIMIVVFVIKGLKYCKKNEHKDSNSAKVSQEVGDDVSDESIGSFSDSCSDNSSHMDPFDSTLNLEFNKLRKPKKFPRPSLVSAFSEDHYQLLFQDKRRSVDPSEKERESKIYEDINDLTMNTSANVEFENFDSSSLYKRRSKGSYVKAEELQDFVKRTSSMVYYIEPYHTTIRHKLKRNDSVSYLRAKDMKRKKSLFSENRNSKVSNTDSGYMSAQQVKHNLIADTEVSYVRPQDKRTSNQSEMFEVHPNNSYLQNENNISDAEDFYVRRHVIQQRKRESKASLENKYLDTNRRHIKNKRLSNVSYLSPVDVRRQIEMFEYQQNNDDMADINKLIDNAFEPITRNTHQKENYTDNQSEKYNVHAESDQKQQTGSPTIQFIQDKPKEDDSFENEDPYLRPKDIIRQKSETDTHDLTRMKLHNKDANNYEDGGETNTYLRARDILRINQIENFDETRNRSFNSRRQKFERKNKENADLESVNTKHSPNMKSISSNQEKFTGNTKQTVLNVTPRTMNELSVQGLPEIHGSHNSSRTIQEPEESHKEEHEMYQLFHKLNTNYKPNYKTSQLGLKLFANHKAAVGNIKSMANYKPKIYEGSESVFLNFGSKV